MADQQTILVIDDDQDVASVLGEFLGGAGYRVAVAHTGAAGLEILRQTPVSLVLLDLVLPDMEGVGLMREVLRLDFPPDVVIITGYATLDSAIAAVEAGAGGYVLKPLDLPGLRTLVGKLLERRHLMRENARLHEQAKRERRQLEVLYDVTRRLAAVHDTDQVLSLIVNEAARLLDADAAGIRLLEGTDLVLKAQTESAATFVSRSRLKVGESLSGLVVAKGEPIVVEDLTQDARYDPAHKRAALERGFHGFLGVPLRAHDRPIGTLNVYAKSRRRFGPEEVSLLCAFADQASLAIEKARLFREAEAREREVTKLYELTGELAASLNADRILNLITAKTGELLGSDASAVLVAADDGLMVLRGPNLDTELRRNVALTLGEDVAWRAFKERRLAWTSDRLADPTLQSMQGADRLVSAQPPRAYMAAPMISRGEVFGVLIVYFFAPRDFTPKEVQLLSTLAHHAAIAIDSSRLFAETQSQRTRLTQIFDSTSDGIMLAGPDGQVLSANRRAGELLGLAPSRVGGRQLDHMLARLGDGLVDGARVRSEFLALLEDPDRGGQGDVEITAPVRRILHWVSQPTKDAAGATIGLTLTFQDVTEEREVSRMKSDFVSFVTHQLRTPLAGIKWLLELVAQGSEIPDETRSFIQDSRDSAERLIRLVNELLDISRLESGKLTIVPRETDLGALTRSVLSELSPLIQTKRHQLELSASDAVPPVLVDPQLLRQVVLNLVSNAVKYTPEGGAIAIRMTREDSRVIWTIRDSGIGIPKEAQRRLFEKFYRADNAVTMETEGTGLGLYLVRLIVERFGGRVWCESEEGKGTSFLFTLPLRE